MKILVINSAEPEVIDYVHPLIRTIHDLGYDAELIEWRKLFLFSAFSDYNAILISASPIGNNANFDERIRAFQWLRECTIPVLGICAGHQFIGSTFGSSLIKNEEFEMGIKQVQILQEDPVFEGCPGELQVLQQHHDSIHLPDGFELLASSEKCKVQAIRHKERLIYGFQWHAEISSENIIRNFLTMSRS